MGGITTTLFQRPRDPQFNNTTLLLSGNFPTNGAQNNTFLDSSSNNFSITRNGNTTQGTFSPFSKTGWSGNFNTSTTYLTVTDTANLRFGSGNFTIEAWVYRSASGATQTIASKGASTPTGWVFQISSADKLVFTDTSTSITGATSLVANTWYYVAVVRTGTGTNQTTLYVNAASDATGTSATNFNQTNNMLIGADRSTTNFANGYISNLRLSNTNRTISSTPTSPLSADANTIFLALNSNWFQYTDSTAAYTAMTVTGTPSVQAFSPFVPSGAYTTTAVGGSGYFDGTGDYLSVPASSDFTFTGNFTIECWFYPTAALSTATSLWIMSIGSGDNFALNVGSTSSIVYLGTAGGNFTATGNTIQNAWNHLAVVRSGSTVTLYINGNAATGTATTSATLGSSTTTFRLGGFAGGIFGYITNWRVNNGQALYTSAFTPPTSPLTTTSQNSTSTNTKLLLNFTNAGIVDSTAKNVLETVGNAQISTTQSRFGGTSMFFDGTGDYLNIPTTNQSLTLGSANWTIEFWIYLPSLPNTRKEILYLNGNTSGIAAMSVHICSNNKLGLSFSESGSAWKTDDTTGIGNALTVTTWQHVAVTRNGQNIQVYLDGVSQGATYTTTAATTSLMTSYTLNQIATYNTSSFQLNAYIDDLRITVGVVRYTANFNVPTIGFTDR